jgi:hypothetical protein
MPWSTWRSPHQRAREFLESLEARSSRSPVSVEDFYPFRYLDEQACRYNNRRGVDDADRFSQAVRLMVGKRLTCAGSRR